LGSKRLDIVFFSERRGALLVKKGDAFFTANLNNMEKVRINLEGEETHHARA
jgi:hypothetical protein